MRLQRIARQVPNRSDCSPFEGDLQDVRRLPARAVDELEKFFEATDALQNKKLDVMNQRAMHTFAVGIAHTGDRIFTYFRKSPDLDRGFSFTRGL
jgi:hypothetical protein